MLSPLHYAATEGRLLEQRGYCVTVGVKRFILVFLEDFLKPVPYANDNITIYNIYISCFSRYFYFPYLIILWPLSKLQSLLVDHLRVEKTEILKLRDFYHDFIAI